MQYKEISSSRSFYIIKINIIIKLKIIRIITIALTRFDKNIIVLTIYVFLKRPCVPCWARVKMKSPHISLKIAHSGCNPSNCMSSFTHCPSLPAPIHTSHPCHHHISTGRHPVVHTFTLRSKCPNHLNLPCITSATLCTPRRQYPHI